MKCAYCGKNNKPGALVCKRCGIALPLTPPSDQKSAAPAEKSESSSEQAQAVKVDKSGGVSSGKPKMNRKAAAIGIASVVGVIAVAVLVIVLLANSGSLILHKNSGYFANGSALFYKGESVVPGIVGNAAAATDLSGKRAAVLCEDGTLYACEKGTNTLAAKNVEKFAFSVNGNYLAYTDSEGLLWRFDCKDLANAPVCIFNNAVKEGFAISPDGNSVLFTRDSDSALCVYIKGKIKAYEGCEGHVPVSVSDGAKAVYSYSPDDNSLYYINAKGKKTQVRSTLIGEIYLNSKHDEIVFAFNSGNLKLQTLISCSGSEPVELCNAADAVRPVLPVSGFAMKDSVPGFDVYTCPFKTFGDKVFYGSQLVRYSKKTGVTVILPDTVSSARASDNYSSVFCVTGSGLSKIDMKAAESPVRVAESCAEFALSSNGKTIWYKDLGDTLHYVKKSKDTAIAGGVGDFAVTLSGKAAAFFVGGKLYVNKSGNPAKSAPVENASPTSIAADVSNLYYLDGASIWKKIDKTGKAENLIK